MKTLREIESAYIKDIGTPEDIREQKSFCRDIIIDSAKHHA